MNRHVEWFSLIFPDFIGLALGLWAVNAAITGELRTSGARRRLLRVVPPSDHLEPHQFCLTRLGDIGSSNDRPASEVSGCIVVVEKSFQTVSYRVKSGSGCSEHLVENLTLSKRPQEIKSKPFYLYVRKVNRSRKRLMG